MFQVISEKTLYNKDIYMKIIVTIIPANLATNSLLSLFCLFVETNNKNQIFTKLVIWQREIFYFLFIASSALLQRYAEFNRLLKKDFLTCYSCSYYNSMVKASLWSMVIPRSSTSLLLLMMIVIIDYFLL